MQGRLLPKYRNEYQSHPVLFWEKEFEIANKIGLKHIEFIFDNNNPHLNPLMNYDGIKKIKKKIKKNKIFVKNICADYFMAKPISNIDQFSFNENIETFKILVKNSSLLGVKDIIIPCVDNSSLNSSVKILNFLRFVDKIKFTLDKFNINFSLETDLNPKKIKKLLKDVDFNKFKINYDVGNSASLGFSIEEEFENYGNSISTIHIKDRKYKKKSVFLGKGDVDFKLFFKLLNKLKFNGYYTMQVYRDRSGLGIFKKQLEFLSKEIISI